MNAFIIYNGALRHQKIEILVNALKQRGIEKGIDFRLIRNNEIFFGVDEYSKPVLKTPHPQINPDFIVFWDKDILLAKRLEKMGYRLFNSSNAIEVCDDKALMHELLLGENIRVPKTIYSPFVFFEQRLSDKYLNNVFEYLGENVIVKENKGSFGMQVHRANRDNIKEIIKNIGSRGFIIQEQILSSYGRDIRVNIIGNEIIGAMKRTSTTDFRANITLGAEGEPYTLTDEEANLALKAHRLLGLDFSGVDLLFGQDHPVLCEINSNVNYISFEKVTGIDYAGKLIDYFINQMKRC